VLIGYQGDYSVDNTDNRLGARYNRKAALEGSNQDRLKQAARAALSAFQHLESEPRMEGKLRFDGREIEVIINDRLLAPNIDATRKAAEADLQIFFRQLFREGELSLSYASDPRRLFSATAKASQRFSWRTYWRISVPESQNRSSERTKIKDGSSSCPSRE